jgi:hypothetical protein
MRGTIPPLPNMSSWRGAYLSTGTTLPFKLHILYQCSYRCLMSGMSFRSFAFSFHLETPCVAEIIKDMTKINYDNLQPIHLKASTEEVLKNKAHEFEMQTINELMNLTDIKE